MTKTKTQKARAKAAKQGKPKQHQPHPNPNRRKKWFIGVDNFRMGSGEAPKPAKSRARNGGLDLISLAPEERGTQASFSRGQLIEQDEFVAVVNASVTFQTTTFILQPGLASQNPWLAQIASLYQKYKIIKWEYYYKPIVSEYDPIGQRGKVIMSFDSDVAGQYLTTFQQAEGMQPHVDFMPYQKASLPLSGKLYSQTASGLFVRSGNVPAGADPKTYDAGILYFSTQGMSGSGAMGELHVRYQVQLINPVLPNVVAPPINYKYSALWTTAVPVALTNGPYTQVTALTPTTINGLGLTSPGGNLVMPAGTFRLDYNARLVNVPGGAFTSALLQIRINGIAHRGTTTGWTGAGGNVYEWEMNGTYTSTFSGGEIVTYYYATNYTITATGEFGLQVTVI